MTKFDRFEHVLFFLSRNLGQNGLLYDIFIFIQVELARKNSYFFQYTVIFFIGDSSDSYILVVTTASRTEFARHLLLGSF